VLVKASTDPFQHAAGEGKKSIPFSSTVKKPQIFFCQHSAYMDLQKLYLYAGAKEWTRAQTWGEGSCSSQLL